MSSAGIDADVPRCPRAQLSARLPAASCRCDCDNPIAQDRRRPVTRLHDSINSGSYVAAPHSHSQLMWGPQEHAIVATIMCPGSSQ